MTRKTNKNKNTVQKTDGVKKAPKHSADKIIQPKKGNIKQSTKAIKTKKSSVKSVNATVKSSYARYSKNKAEAMQKQLDSALSDYGKMVETVTNLRIKIDVMLGQIIKGLYIVGITPDMIIGKCQQMFNKKVIAD